MAPPKRRTGGRVTPKGTGSPTAAQSLPTAEPSSEGVHRASNASSRYTPPKAVVIKEPSKVLPIVMFALWILGALVIMLNYVGLLPGAADNRYLLVGLVLILVGLFLATKWE